jgi:hypothetical protein
LSFFYGVARRAKETGLGDRRFGRSAGGGGQSGESQSPGCRRQRKAEIKKGRFWAVYREGILGFGAS